MLLDWFLIALGFVFLFLGLLGCLAPVIPGPPLGYVGLLLMSAAESVSFAAAELWWLLAATVLVTVLDYLVQPWLVKRAGGSRRAVVGATVGLVAGMFVLPPWGVILGPFFGAFVGELTAGRGAWAAFRGGMGAFAGFLVGTLLKMAVAGYMLLAGFRAAI